MTITTHGTTVTIAITKDTTAEDVQAALAGNPLVSVSPDPTPEQEWERDERRKEFWSDFRRRWEGHPDYEDMWD